MPAPLAWAGAGAGIVETQPDIQAIWEEISVNPDELAVENRVMLSSGDLAEIIEIDAAAFQVQVRYLDAMGDASMVGSGDLGFL